jgi:hypothetical protein
MEALLGLLPPWLKQWVQVYLVPLLKLQARRLLRATLWGGLETLLFLTIPAALLIGSHAVWSNRYALTVAQQEQVARWASVSASVARLEDVPPVVPLVLWYKERGLQANNPSNCEGIMGLHTAVTSGRAPCFRPGPISTREIVRQLRLGARIFKEHCPEVHYETADPELLKRCYLYYNAGRGSRLDPDRSGYVMNGYDVAHQNMYHVSEQGEVVRLQALGAWPVHLTIQTQLAQTSPARSLSLLRAPNMVLQEIFDRLRTTGMPTGHRTADLASAPRCREPLVEGCFSPPHEGSTPLLRPVAGPLLSPVHRASRPVCGSLPGVQLEPSAASVVVAPMPGQLAPYADRWGHLAVRIENQEWIVWLAGLRSYTVSPGPVEVGQPIGAIGGPGSTPSIVHYAVFDKVNNDFVDPVAFLPVENCPLSYVESIYDEREKEERMNLLALLPIVIVILGIVWIFYLFFKKDLLSEGPVQVIFYFLGVFIVLFIVGWLIDEILPNWIAERLVAAQRSEEIETIEVVSRDILDTALDMEVDNPPPTVFVQPPAPTTIPPQLTPGAPVEPTPDTTLPGDTQDLLAGERVHVVQPGENLYRISLQYGVSQAAIQQRNNLTNPNQLRAGQQLIIPAP